jgi:hypothetical protein
VDDEKDVALHFEDDAFAYPTNPDDVTACHLGGRWLDRADYEGVAYSQPLEGLTDDAAGKGFNVERDVRKLGHLDRLYAPKRLP